MSEKVTIRRQDIINKLSGENLFELVVRTGWEEKFEKAGFTEKQIEMIERKLAEMYHDAMLELIKESLLIGERIELKNLLMLQPYQSGYDLKEKDLGENTDAKKNKVRIVLRKKFSNEFNKVKVEKL